MIAERNIKSQAPGTINQRRFVVPMIVLLALLLRLLLWSQPLHQPANDEVEYIAVARDLLAGHGWQFYEHYRWLRAPLYPLFLAGSLWLANGDLHLAALPNLALSTANVYLLYQLALALAGRRAARVAALLAALLWTQATFASLYMSETLFTFLFTGALLCLVRSTTDDGRRTTNDERRTTDGRTITLSPRHLARSRWPLILAGVLFGLATLTRSITLLFLPIVALWLLAHRPTPALERSEGTDDRRPTTADTPQVSRFTFHAPRFSSAICSLLFVLCSLLTIAPWTVRNYLAYGRPILVETGLSFNLWFFYEPRESNDQIYRALESIPNPAERSDYATAKGLARLREDPAILLRNLAPNLVALLSADTTEDRFIMESYYADVGLPLFAAALIFDDALYPLILLAGVAGLLLLCPPAKAEPPSAQGKRFALRLNRAVNLGGPKWLFVAWVVYVVATVLLTHGETRYRHFLFPALIPYAAWMLAQGRTERQTSRLETRDRRHETGPRSSPVSCLVSPASLRSPSLASSVSGRLLAVAALWGLMLGMILGVYPWGWAGQGLARGWQVAAGDIAWAAGDIRAAGRAYQRAADIQETPDVWLRRGDAARALGDDREALRAYRAAVSMTPPYIAASARLGDLLRELGDDQAARDAFKGEYADQQQMADWAWRELRPAPLAALDIGDGLDFGYVGGVYPAEEVQGETARWIKGSGALRLSLRPSATRAGPMLGLVRLRMAAPRPAGPPARAEICAAESCHTLEIAPAWRDYDLLFNMTPGQPLAIEIESDTFRPRDYDPASADERTLGVLLSRAAVAPLAEPPYADGRACAARETSLYCVVEDTAAAPPGNAHDHSSPISPARAPARPGPRRAGADRRAGLVPQYAARLRPQGLRSHPRAAG